MKAIVLNKIFNGVFESSEAVLVNQLSQRETIEPKTNLKLYMVTSVLAPYYYLRLPVTSKAFVFGKPRLLPLHIFLL